MKFHFVRIIILTAFFQLSFVQLAQGANECGSIVSNAVTCNGDGTPATDVASNTTGISYTSAAFLTLNVTNVVSISTSATNIRGISLTNTGTSSGNRVINADATSISTSGATAYGIALTNNASFTGNLIINSLVNNITTTGSGATGIIIQNNGTVTGNITIDSSSDINSSSSVGISLQNTSTNNISVISRGNITSNLGGIFITATNSSANITLTSGKTISSIATHGMNVTASNSIFNIDGAVVGGSNSNAYGLNLTGTSSATVNVSSTGSISAVSGNAINSGAPLTLNNSGTITGKIDTSTTLSNVDTINLLNGSTTSGTIALGLANDIINISNGANISGITSYDGGAGTDSLSFNNNSINTNLISNFENITASNNASLIVSSADFALTGTLTNNTSTVSVANSRILTVNGSYNQDVNGIFKTAVLSNSNYGKLVVNGTATLASGSKIDVDVLALNTIAVGQTLSSVISATTLNASTLNITDNSALFNFNYVINGNAVDLVTVTATSGGGSSSGNSVSNSTLKHGFRNSIGAATVLDELIAKSASGDMANIITALGSLSSEREVAIAASQITPAINSYIPYITSKDIIVTNILNDRIDMIRGFNSGDKLLTAKTLWIKPFASYAKQNNQGGVGGYNQNSYGIVIGSDGEISDNDIIGLAVAISKGDVKSNSADSKQTVELTSYQLKLYQAHNFAKSLLLTSQLSFGTANYDSLRLIDFGGINRAATASYEGWNSQVSFNLEKKFSFREKSSLIPFLKTEYGYSTINSYHEEGAGAANLIGQKSNDDTLLIGSGLRLLHHFSDHLSSSVNAGISYDFLADSTDLTTSFEGGGSTFTTSTTKPDPVIYDLGFTTSYDLNDMAEISGNYSLNKREDYASHSFYLNLKVEL